MMSSGSHEEDDFSILEHRCDYRDVCTKRVLKKRDIYVKRFWRRALVQLYCAYLEDGIHHKLDGWS
jgi:hypothetical protein